MFGHVQANLSGLSETEQERYKAVYCGLCRTLGKRHGFLSRMSLTYDLAFLALLLSSLYEPEECQDTCRCCVHPCKKRAYMVNEYTEYAADMTIALTYHKCLDDWEDDRNIPKKLYAMLLKKHYRTVKARWSRQCEAIEHYLQELSNIEHSSTAEPDAAAKCFGQLLAEVFVYRPDHWEPYLRRMGSSLGEYIYWADAVEDLEKDQKKGAYNPLNSLSSTPKEMRPALEMVLGEASEAFEALPLVQDIHLLRNILYSGIWIRYNRAIQKEEKVKE